MLNEKKGAWYSLEYIEELDYIVCGYQTGEILIFKETDFSLIRTFRPRFKRIRKILYSPENSSVFASYDDGFIVVINLINFKINSYKMSSSQIYAMEIIPNLNALIFGGVEKKILYSYIIDLNKILLFYDSKEGEVQSLLYDDKKDILVSAMRKSTIIFFKNATQDEIFRHEFKEADACAMTIKKYKDDFVFTCGYFLNLHQFKMCFNDTISIEYVGCINLGFVHIYDLIFLDDSFALATTFDENKIALVDINKKRTVKSFDGFKGVIQIKNIKNSYYITSHSDSLKKLN